MRPYVPMTLFCLPLLATAALAANRPTPPETRQVPVQDVLHGVTVTDPYRWLEEGESPDVQRWVEEQNQYTRAMLDPQAGRAKLEKRLDDLLHIGSISAPTMRKDRYFYFRREGDQNHAVLYWRQGLSGADKVLLDPNRFSQDGTVALDWHHLSPDGKRLAYGVSEGGSEQSTLKVLDVDSGSSLPDVIPNTRACALAWLPDGSGFYYTRYQESGTVPADESAYHRRVYFHRLGTDWKQDPEVFKPDHYQDWPNVDLSPDGRHLLVTVSQGWAKTEVFYRDLKDAKGRFQPVVTGKAANFYPIAYNDRLYVFTNHGASRYKVMATPYDQLAPSQWQTLIPESDATLEGVVRVGHKLYAQYLDKATSQIRVHDLNGRRQKDLPLPTIGTVAGLNGEWDGHELFFTFSSFAVPPSIYRVAADSDALSLWKRVDVPFDPSQIDVKQVWYASKDGTRVSMFVVHKKGLQLNGQNPTLLTGYGGFNSSETPYFGKTLMLWLEKGGVYALPNLRGGGEYGEDWHRNGMLDKKQNVFDDFIGAAEWLIQNRYTEPAKLAISGGSNGGLLVGATLTQRPDLFQAAVSAVPLLDMLRYHQFLIARLWIPEYGSADDPEQFKWLYAYSPYHRIQDKTPYPAILLTTANSDSRVDPLHARKMAARLQAATSSDRPILLRVENKAGHGAGKPLAKIRDEQLDYWTFLFWQLGVTP